MNTEPQEKILYYNVVPKRVIVSGQVKTEKYCNSVEVVNVGTVVAVVNGLSLNPPAAGEVLGDSTSWGGNKGEIYIGRIDIQFAAAGGAVFVRQKIYQPGWPNDLQKELNADK